MGKSVSDELANFIFYDKYSRYDEKLKRRETWEEAVKRVEDMHLRKFEDSLVPARLYEIQKAFDLAREKRVLPSMRSLQFGGKAMETNNARGYNCAVRHVDSIRAFSELFFLLLSGCGVGIGITRRHLSKLPNFVPSMDKPFVKFTIDDSIEGWADSLQILLQSYFQEDVWSGCPVVFDYSRIRPKGAHLKTSGGLAPGSNGLRFSHEKIRQILNEAIKNQTHIKTIQAYDILMHVADAVLSGGVRRAACSVLFDKSDTELLTAKTGNWLQENPQRARSNNSVLLLRKTTTLNDLKEIVECTRQWGEPAFVFVDHEDTIYNPCFEVGFLPIYNGTCGVQFCNLTTINGTKIETEEQLFQCVEAAALIGTLQATYTKFPYLSKEAQLLTEQEALLGVSILGILSNPLLYNTEVQRKAAKIAVETNKRWAKLFGINQAARTTLVKPDGQSALCVGSMLSGIHAAHAHKMFRRVQVNKSDPVYRYFKTFNPELCEESVWSATGTDDIITFPVEVSQSAMVKSDLTSLQHLDIIRSTQENWVLPGTTEANMKPLSHNVSCTVQVDDWDTVVDYIYAHRNSFSAVSLISQTGDKDYQQAPMEAVTTQEDMRKFHFLQNQLIPVDYTQLVENKDATTRRDQIACNGQQCDYL
jgi:ribonucleoside-diphosphate reductase alpha chain